MRQRSDDVFGKISRIELKVVEISSRRRRL